MTGFSLRRLIFLGISALPGCVGTSSASDIPSAALAEVLRAGALPEPWHIDQLSYRQNGERWEVDIYYDPHSVGSDICVAKLIITDMTRVSGEYSIQNKLPPQRVAALEGCDTAAKFGHLVDVDEGVTDQQLESTANAVIALAGGKDEAPVRYESEKLKPLLRKVRPDHLHWIRKDRNGSIKFGFFVRDIAPDLLSVGVDPDGSIYVYRENGPDIVRLRTH